MAKKGRANPSVPRNLFAAARFDIRSGLRTGARLFGEKFDDIKSPAGRSRDYDYAGINAVAENIAKDGVDDRQSWFFDRVRDECERGHPRITAPPDNRTMRRIIGDVFKRAKVASR